MATTKRLITISDIYGLERAIDLDRLQGIVPVGSTGRYTLLFPQPLGRIVVAKAERDRVLDLFYGEAE